MRNLSFSVILILFCAACSMQDSHTPPPSQGSKASMAVIENREAIKITPIEAKAKVESGALLVDVRTPGEVAQGAIRGSKNINSATAEQNLSQFGADKNREIVLYCRSGHRAGEVAKLLTQNGFTRVYNAGGYDSLRGTM